jgi:hypothetical protein
MWRELAILAIWFSVVGMKVAVFYLLTMPLTQSVFANASNNTRTNSGSPSLQCRQLDILPLQASGHHLSAAVDPQWIQNQSLMSFLDQELRLKVAG